MRLIKMIAMVMILCSSDQVFGKAKSFADFEAEMKNFGQSQAGSLTGNMQGMFDKHLTPTEKDKKFMEENKDKYPNLKKRYILDARKSRFDKEVAKGRIADPTKIDPKDLNERSTQRSLDAHNKDRSGTTPAEYIDLASDSLDKQNKYKKDVEESWVKESLEIIKDPNKTLQEYGVGIDCEEVDMSSIDDTTPNTTASRLKRAFNKQTPIDHQELLNPDVEEYTTKTKSKQIVEEEETCEESEPVVLQCDRSLNLSCLEEKIVKEDPNKMDWSEGLKGIIRTYGIGGRMPKPITPSRRVLHRMILFLHQKEVCFVNMPKHINPYWVANQPDFTRSPISANGMRRMAQARLGMHSDHPCEVPPEKECIKWQEKWENKCEEELKGK